MTSVLFDLIYIDIMDIGRSVTYSVQELLCLLISFSILTVSYIVFYPVPVYDRGRQISYTFTEGCMVFLGSPGKEEISDKYRYDGNKERCDSKEQHDLGP